MKLLMIVGGVMLIIIAIAMAVGFGFGAAFFYIAGGAVDSSIMVGAIMFLPGLWIARNTISLICDLYLIYSTTR